MMAKKAAERFASYDDLLDGFAQVFREPAGIWLRAQAMIIDGVLLGLLAAGIGVVVALLRHRPTGNLADVIIHVLGTLYGVTCLARWGRTAGKAAVGIEVVPLDRAGPPGLRLALVRVFWQGIVPYAFLCAGWLSGKELFELLGYASLVVFAILAWLRSDRRAFWDLRARTIVLKKQRREYRPAA
jgi:uncharacterized RDD family membrane protein YckC